MKRMIIAIFSLISVVELLASYSQKEVNSKGYSNREFSISSKSSNKSANESENLTFAQQQVRKFMNQKDTYSKKN